MISSQPAPNAFIDAVIGGGGLRFDSIRDVANGATARGRRDGSMWFGSLSAGIDRTTDSWRLSAYGRADYLSADLDAYTETGGGTANLRFAQRDLTSLSGLIGVREDAGAALLRLFLGELGHEEPIKTNDHSFCGRHRKRQAVRRSQKLDRALPSPGLAGAAGSRVLVCSSLFHGASGGHDAVRYGDVEQTVR